jgi:hypothetical protein
MDLLYGNTHDSNTQRIHVTMMNITDSNSKPGSLCFGYARLITIL